MPDEFPYDVFLSHSAKDKAMVRPLAEALRADGVEVKAEFTRQKDEIEPPPSSFFLPTSSFEKRRFLPLRLDDAPIKGSDWLRKDDDVRWQFSVPPKGNPNFASRAH